MAEDTLNISDTGEKGSGMTGHSPRRIIYVDPNDVYGHSNGVPLTPDYTDFCISFDLIVRKARRNGRRNFNGSSDDGGIDEKRIHFDSVLEESLSTNTGVQMGHGDSPRKIFQSTYYTDVNKEDFEKTQIAEGLGVTSIDISYESFYCPTVRMHLVDVRGASVFGVEETAHDQWDNATRDNLYSAFFTLPYPEFKLQVKGFYGQAVTFQLCCTDFRGEFNSDTGNFEADVTFLGYDYGLLAEIPFRYIVAAPLCEYAGVDYWNKKVNSPEWQLTDGSSPIKLNDFASNISRFLEEGDNGEGGQNATVDMANESRYEESLQIVSNAIKEFRDFLFKDCQWYAQHGEGKLFVFSTKFDGNSVSVDKRDALLNAIDNHNKLYNNEIDGSMIEPLGTGPSASIWNRVCSKKNGNWLGPMSGDSVCQLSFDYDIASDSVYTVKIAEHYLSMTKLFSDGVSVKVSGDAMNEITDKLTLLWNNNDNGLTFPDALFGAALDITDLVNFVDSKIQESRKRIEKINQNRIDYVNGADLSAIKNAVGTIPFIGDVFKTIMCHVETFLHIVNTCVDNIYAQELSGDMRSMDKLGQCSSDMVEGDFILPFPGLLKPDVRNSSSSDGTGGVVSNSNTNNNVVCYTADCTDGANFEETLLVKALLRAMQYVQMSSDDQQRYDELTREMYLPPVPFECDSDNSMGICDGPLDNMAGYLATRAAIAIGVMNGNTNGETELYELLGRLEAYNYFFKVRDANKIKNTFFKANNGGDLAQTLYDISVCNDKASSLSSNVGKNGKSFFAFERQPLPKYKNRQPVFTENENGIDLSYVYTHNKYKRAMIPASIDKYEQYIGSNGCVKYNGSDCSCFEGNCDTELANGVLWLDNREYVAAYHPVQTVDNDVEISASQLDEVLGRYNFEIYAGKGIGGEDYGYGWNVTEKTRDVYKKLQNRRLDYGNYHGEIDFGKVIESHWDLEESGYAECFTYNKGILSETYGFERQNVFPLPWSNANVQAMPIDVTKGWEEKIGPLYTPRLSSGVVKAKNYEAESEDVWIPELNMTYILGNAPQKFSVFGHPFYYCQNSNDSYIVREGAKCLLFLYSLNYDMNRAMELLKKTENSKGMIKSAPYGMLLLLGGILWRYRQSSDPLVSKDGDIEYNISKDMTMFERNGDKYEFVVRQKDRLATDEQNLNTYLSVTELFTNVGYYAKNRLVKLFLDFVEKEWKFVSSNHELRHEYGVLMKSSDFRQFVNNIKGKSPAKVFPELRKTNFLLGYVLYQIPQDDFPAMRMLFRDTTGFVSMKLVYFTEVIIADTCCFADKPNGDADYLSIKKADYMSYLRGFSKALSDVTGNVDSDAVAETVTNAVEDTYYPVELSIYQYLKHMWDKWLIHDYFDTDNKDKDDVSYGRTKYDVGTYFANNFVFIDSFYNNIYHQLRVNCNQFLTVYQSNVVESGGFVSQVFNKVANDNQCLMFGFPGYGFFSNQNDDGDKMMEHMKTLFKPVPYSEKDPISSTNKFAVIYVQKASDIESTCKEYKGDSFNIWFSDAGNIGSYDNRFMWPDQLDDDYEAHGKMAYENQISKPGYRIPSFGVAYSRSNNAVFKKINVNMSTPMVTQQTATVMQQLAEKGGSNDHKITFVGQDLYNIYSNYAYMCDIEMMGNAQILPLMYFQLTNIPMFRGTYMVVSVNHSITPGRMITRIRGMKMSRNQLPYNKQWFFRKSDNIFFSGGSDTTKSCSNAVGTGNYPDNYTGSTEVNDKGLMTIQDIKNAIYDDFDRTKPIKDDNLPKKEKQERNNKSHEYDANIAYMLNTTLNPLLKLYNQTYGTNLTKFPMTSGLRVWDPESRHGQGCAVDIQFEGSTSQTASTRDKARQKNFDLYELLYNSGIPFEQVILEYGEMSSNGKVEVLPRWIHISVSVKEGENTRQRYYDKDGPNPTKMQTF